MSTRPVTEDLRAAMIAAGVIRPRLDAAAIEPSPPSANVLPLDDVGRDAAARELAGQGREPVPHPAALRGLTYRLPERERRALGGPRKAAS